MQRALQLSIELLPTLLSMHATSHPSRLRARSSCRRTPHCHSAELPNAYNGTGRRASKADAHEFHIGHGSLYKEKHPPPVHVQMGSAAHSD